MNWSPLQESIFDWVTDGVGSANVIARAGTGKCLGRGTPVMLFDGSIVPVEEVEYGDLLMGPDSRPRIVFDTTTGRGPLYRITPIKGDSWVCNDAHVMTFVGCNHQAGKIIDVPLRDHLKSSNTVRPDKEWKLFRVPVSFREQAVPFDPYVVGVWLGDGSVGETQITLGYDKADVLEYLKTVGVKECGPLVTVRTDERTNTWNVRFHTHYRGESGYPKDHPFREYVNNVLYQKKQKTIDPLLLMNSTTVREQVLAGLLDTDGSQDPGGCFSITTKYEKLRDDILFLARSLGLAAYSSEKLVKLPDWDEPRPYQRISLSGDFTSLPMLRHETEPRQQIKNVLRTGWNAESIGVGEYFGFTLSGDGRFLLGDFTVTHNTTTLVEAVNRTKGRALCAAFNKSIADELAARVHGNPSATAATLHSVGFSLWRKVRPKSEVDSRKVRSIVKTLIPYDPTYTDILCDAVGYAKGAGFGIPEVGPFEHDTEAGQKLWSDMMDFHDLWDEVPSTITPERVIEDCAKIYQQSIISAKYDGKIDFNDMILLPLLPEFAQGKSYGQYDWVMVDEAQDTSDTRRLLALSVLKNGGRFVAVGDPAQSIYLFAGASLDAMTKIKNATGAVELPLNITYRCPQSVVKMAQKWVPDFIAHESAPEGIVRTIHHSDFWMEKLTSRDAILCRNTRPLVGIASRLRDNGIQCVVEGQSGKALIGLATKWGEIEIRDLLMNLEAYREKEVDKWLTKGRDDKAEWVNEKVGILSDIARGMPEDDSINKLVQKIEYTFGEGQYQGRDILRLCTIHRSKGREWDRVYLVGRNRYMPSKWAKKEHAIAQENNLAYVAVTRTKEELVEVKVPIPDPKKVSQGDWWEMGL